MIQSRQVPIFCTSNIIRYIVWIVIVAAMFVTGLSLALTAKKDEREHNLTGTVLSAYCSQVCDWGCRAEYHVNIHYTVNNISYTYMYNTANFEGCIGPFNTSTTVCCQNLINQTVNLDVYQDNPSVIKSASLSQEYYDGYRILFATIMFIGVIVTICLFVWCGCRRKNQYISM